MITLWEHYRREASDLTPRDRAPVTRNTERQKTKTEYCIAPSCIPTWQTSSQWRYSVPDCIADAWKLLGIFIQLKVREVGDRLTRISCWGVFFAGDRLTRISCWGVFFAVAFSVKILYLHHDKMNLLSAKLSFLIYHLNGLVIPYRNVALYLVSQQWLTRLG